MALINSQYFAAERQWLQEWMNQYHPLALIQFEKRLTVADVAAQQRMGGNVKPRAASRIVAKLDAWVDLPGEIQLWEAKRRAPVAAVLQLRGYQIELPNTWEGQNEAIKPLSFHVLAEHYQDRAERLAAEWGIFYHVFLPDWLKELELQTMAAGQARRFSYLASIGKTPVP